RKACQERGGRPGSGADADPRGPVIRLEAAMLRAAQGHAEAVALDDAVGDVEAQAEAVRMRLARLVAAPAPLHQALQLVLGHAGASSSTRSAKAAVSLFE